VYRRSSSRTVRELRTEICHPEVRAKGLHQPDQLIAAAPITSRARYFKMTCSRGHVSEGNAAVHHWICSRGRHESA
jgi:hypothetical protein